MTPGALAKLALAAEVTGKDPTNFAGVDLVALLVTLQNADTGRFADRQAPGSPYPDSTNAFGQSLAVIALDRIGTHPTETTAAAHFLTSIQCTDGGFPLDLNSPADPSKCDSQVDATAMVVQALLAAGETKAADKGLDWLVSKQKPSGGFDDDYVPPAGQPNPINSNSTGLAAQALRAGGRPGPADAAAAFIVSLQVGCGGPADQLGGIAYDATGFDPANAVRATAQAILGLGGASLADLSVRGAEAGAPTMTCPTTPTAEPTTPAAAAPELPKTGTPLTVVLVSAAVLIVAGVVLLVTVRMRRRPVSR
jgi:hypothetical protein